MEVRVNVPNKTIIDIVIDNGVVPCEEDPSHYFSEIIRFDDDLAGIKASFVYHMELIHFLPPI